MSEENGADVDLEIGGQKVSVKNVKSLNTLATVATFVGVCLLLYGGYTHTLDAKDRDRATDEREKAYIAALKEQTAAYRDGNSAIHSAIREQTCVLKFEGTQQRQANADFCKQVSGSR